MLINDLRLQLNEQRKAHNQVSVSAYSLNVGARKPLRAFKHGRNCVKNAVFKKSFL